MSASRFPTSSEAEHFFVDVVGCEKAMSFGPFRDDKGTFMQDLLNVDPRAVIEQITQLRCGHGSNIELFQYTAPDQKTDMPKNSDYGGHHLAFYVEDINAAAAYFKENGIRTLMGPLPDRRRTGGRADDPVFLRALGPAARSDHLSGRDGLREGRRADSLVDPEPGGIGARPTKGAARD